MQRTICLTPEPLGPTIPIVCPDFNEKERPPRTNASGLEGYEKQTLSKHMLSNFKVAADTTSGETKPIFRVLGKLVTNDVDAATFI